MSKEDFVGVRLLRCCAIFALVLFTCPSWAAEDDYLQSLEMESGKVEQGVDPEVAAKSRSEMQVQRAAFETLLEEEYRGTYVFYKRLNERSRQEVFLRYAGGASMKEVREMIIDRSLQR